jgi:hypothetical protein
MADAMSVTCPTCHAAPGRTCRGDLPPVPVETHLTRMLASMREKPWECPDCHRTDPRAGATWGCKTCYQRVLGQPK